VCTLYPFFDPLAQLIAEQFSIAEVNKKYFTLSIIKHTSYVTTTADESARDHVIARMFVYVVNQKVN